MNDNPQNNQQQRVMMKTRNRLALLMVMTMSAFLLSSCGLFSNTGSFTATVDPYQVTAQSIAISESAGPVFDEGLLSVNASLGVTGGTYEGLPMDDILKSEGFLQDTDKTYVSYAFYLTNTGTTTVFINVEMRLTEVSYGMDDHIRFLLIKEDGTQKVFKKADEPEPETSGEVDPPYTVASFESDTIVFWDAITQLRPSEVVAFKVVIWADSDDSDLLEADLRGTLKAIMTFQIAGTEEKGTAMPGDRRLWITLMTKCSVEFEIRHEDNVETA